MSANRATTERLSAEEHYLTAWAAPESTPERIAWDRLTYGARRWIRAQRVAQSSGFAGSPDWRDEAAASAEFHGGMEIFCALTGLDTDAVRDVAVTAAQRILDAPTTNAS